MTEDQIRQQRRRGRPRSPEKTQETARAILEAATSLFLESGFVATSMEEVAKRASVAKGTLYLYHPTKASMLEAVLKNVIADPIVAISNTPAAHGESVQGFLRRTVVPLLRDTGAARRKDMLRLILGEAPRFPELAAIYRRLVIDPMSAFLQSLAVRAVEGGELRSQSDALVRFPLLLMTPILMTTVWNGLHEAEDHIDASEAFEASLDLIFIDQREADRGS